MIKKYLAIFVMALAPAVIVGCASSEDQCNDLCEKSNGCEGVEQQDCATSCADAEEVNDAVGCSGEYSDFLSCADSNFSCDENTACSSEAEAYVGCVLAYCLTNPTDPACSAE